MTDTDDLELTRRLITSMMQTLLVQSELGVYPYELREQRAPGTRFSMSTNSMIAHALAAMGGFLPGKGVLAVCGSARAKGFTDGHADCLRRATRRIVSGITSSGDESPYWSSSFGLNDPLTLAWLVELFTARTKLSDLTSEDSQRAWTHLAQTASDRVTKALEPASLNRPLFDFDDRRSDGNSSPVLHPLPVLRILQLARMLQHDTSAWRPQLFEWFLTRLYRQLSLLGIEHSEFDIADVVFSLEGLLVTDRPKVTSPIVDSVCRVIEEVRALNPTLRPITPFKTSAQGAVHLFSSVEVFSSLLRSAELIQENGGKVFFVRIKPLLSDYLSWLQGTTVSGRVHWRPPDVSADSGADRFPEHLPERYTGWQSEYVHAEFPAVHVWLTSQVVLYLHGYELLLARDVARQVLESVSLRAEPPAPASTFLDPVHLEDYRVVSRLEREFVEPHMIGDAAASVYSCLLYGPPGTGKTTLARWVADLLDLPLLTITTSDFIIDGEAQVEARAKRLFEALERQRDVVVFFDEIDRLVLSRDAVAYRRQGDMLQFMTPSMLTKINNLRASERVVFLVGTNYAESIDAAITRPGRIDLRLLVLPPDLARRKAVLDEAVRELRPDHRTTEDEIDRAASEGVWRTIPELRTAVRRYRDVGRDPLHTHVASVEPAVSLGAYRRRVDSFKPESDTGDLDWCPRELLEEAFLLEFLWLEGKNEPQRAHSWLAPWWTARGHQVVTDPTVRERLDQAWPG